MCACVHICVYMCVFADTHTMALLRVPSAYDPTYIRGSGNIAESLMVFDIMAALFIKNSSFHS